MTPIGPDRPAAARRRRLAGCLIMTATLAVTITAPAAGQAPFFRAQGCSPTYRAESISTYSTAKTPSYRRALHRWRFDDAGGTKLQPPVNWRMRRAAGTVSKIHQMKYLDRLFGIADERKLRSTDPFSRSERRLALRHAVALAADWSKAANRGRVPKRESWKPRVAAIRAPYLAYAARRGACAGVLSNDQAREIRKALNRHVAPLRRRPPASTPHNHKLSIYSGAAMLGSYFPADKTLRSVADRAGRRFLSSIRGGYEPREGVWLEHSPRYQRLAYELLDGWIKRVDPGARAVRQARDRLLASLGRLILPDDRLVTFGDTSGERIQDGEILSAVRDGWWVAPRSGYASYRDGDSWFGITAQYHSRQHKQADELSFDLFDRGQHLIQDTGFLHKDRDRWWRYQQSAQAHSTLTVDGRDFNWKLHQRPYGSAVRASGAGDGWYAIRATNPLLVAPRDLTRAQRRHSRSFKRTVRRKLRRARRFDARHTRTYLYKPGEALIVADAVRSKRTHTYRRRFQFAPGVTATALLGGVSFLAGPASGAMVTDSLGPPATLDLRTGINGTLEGFVFPRTGERSPRTTAVWTTRSRDLDQATGLFYGPSKVRALKVHAGLASTVKIELRGALGSTISTLSVSRTGGKLAVNEQS